MLAGKVTEKRLQISLDFLSTYRYISANFYLNNNNNRKQLAFKLLVQEKSKERTGTCILGFVNMASRSPTETLLVQLNDKGDRLHIIIFSTPW